MNLTIELFAQALALGACLVIVLRCENTINHMTRTTPMLVRLAFWLLLVGAVGSATCIVLAGDVPPWPAVIGVWGAALMLFSPRRLRYLAHRPKGRAGA